MNSFYFFLISLISIITILILVILDIFVSKVSFWPPPKKNSWQFYFFWFFFITFFVCFFIVFILEIQHKNSNKLLLYIGWLIAILGFFLSNLISFQLGVENSSGQNKGLVTTGWYSISRNPVYVMTMITLFGVVLVEPTYKIITLSLLWGILYLIAPILEEAWLESLHGSSYKNYKKKVRRFF